MTQSAVILGLVLAVAAGPIAAQIPGATVSVLPVGPSCAVAPGLLPSQVSLTATPPHLGSDCLLRIDQSPSFVFPFTTTWLVLLSAPTAVPYPVSFGSSAPCWYWGDPHATVVLGAVTFPSISGSGSIVLPVPQDPALLGYRLRAQAYRLGVPGTQSTPTLSNGLELTAGL